MNPLQRRLFRLQQPGMSRQPMGILASSPQLMTAAQKAMMQGQPMKAQTGASVNTGRKVTVSGQEYTITNQGVFDSRGAPVTNPNVISMIQKQNVIDAANPVSGMLRQFEVGDVDLSAALTDATGRRPIGRSEGGRERTEKLTQVPGKIAEGVGSVLDEVTRTRGPAVMDIVGPFPDSPLKKFMRSFSAGNKLQATPDESSGMSVSGDEPTGMLGIPTVASVPLAVAEKLTRAGDPAKAKGDLSMGIQDDPNLRPQLEKNIEASISARMADKGGADSVDVPDLTGLNQKGIPPEGRPLAANEKTAPDGPVILTPEVLENIATGTEGFDEDGADMNLVAQTGQTLADQANSIMGSRLSAEGINRQIDQIMGIDAAVQQKTGKPATKKERIKAEAALLKDALGDDAAKDIRTSGSYNLMMAGLMIAAGESPNAMTNIAKGLASGLKSYGDAAGEEAQRKNKLEQSLGLQAFNNVTQEMAAEKLAEAKTKEQKASLGVQLYLANIREQGAMDRLALQQGFDSKKFKEEMAYRRDSLKQALDIAKMPPADVRTLLALQESPELIETMSIASLAKDPYQLETQITKHMLSSPYTSMMLMQPGGAEQLTSVAKLMADSFRKSRGLTSGAAPAAPEATGATPAAPSISVSGLSQRQKDAISGAAEGSEFELNGINYKLEGDQLVPM